MAALRLTAQTATQCAVIQYLGAQQANDILSGRCSVGIKGSSETLNNGVISLWATTDATLPDIKSANFDSIVATLNADGSVATRNGTWTELTRKSGPGKFTFALSDSGTYLSGWEDNVAAPLAGTATYFAIVVGFDALANTDWINLDWVTLNAGDIATPPAPQTPDEVLRECQRYYEMSYASAAVVDTALQQTNALTFPQNSTQVSGGNSTCQPNGFHINFHSAKEQNLQT